MTADDSGNEVVSAPPTTEVPGTHAPRGTITLLTEASCTRLVMAGEVDVSMNADLSLAVEIAASRGLSVEVLTKDVTSIDTAVIGMQAHLANLLDRPLRFAAPPAFVRSLLDLTGIADTVEIIDREPELSLHTAPAATPVPPTTPESGGAYGSDARLMTEGGAMTSTEPQQPLAGWVALMTSSTHLRLVLGGEVDTTVTVELNEAISEAARQRLPVEVDTRQVTFMDSMATAALARLAAGRDEPLRFVDPPEIVRFLLDVTQFGEVVEIQEDDPGFPSTTVTDRHPPDAPLYRPVVR